MTVSKKVFLIKSVIHVIALGLLINQFYLAIADQLGGDPVKAIIHFTGIGAFNLLLITLTVTPIAQRFKLGYLMQVRRLLGLYAFTYASCHLLSFIAFDLQFEWQLIIKEILERPYITVGMLAFLWLVPMAVTSIGVIKRKMKSRWQKLHYGNYIIVTLVAIHFYWSVKSELIEPGLYIVITFVLLWLRKDRIYKILTK